MCHGYDVVTMFRTDSTWNDAKMVLYADLCGFEYIDTIYITFNDRNLFLEKNWKRNAKSVSPQTSQVRRFRNIRGDISRISEEPSTRARNYRTSKHHCWRGPDPFLIYACYGAPAVSSTLSLAEYLRIFCDFSKKSKTCQLTWRFWALHGRFFI